MNERLKKAALGRRYDVAIDPNMRVRGGPTEADRIRFRRSPARNALVLMMMKYLFVIPAAILLVIAPCWADAKSTLFREAFACSERGPSSICIYGAIPKGKEVTVLAKGWKSPAVPKGEYPNKEMDNGVKRITQLRVATPPPGDAFMIAVLAAADSVTEVPFEAVQDEALVGKIGQYIKRTNALNLDPDIRLLKTRLLRASPTIVLSETFLSPPDHVATLEKQLPTGCNDCENVPLLVGTTLEDLFKELRSKEMNSVEHTCGGIKLAYTLSGRLHLLSHAFRCESDSLFATLVHDLSGPKPRLVFKMVGGL